MKVERNRVGNKYTFTPEDEKDEKFLDRIAQLEEENKKLKDHLKWWRKQDEIDMRANFQLAKENKKLKEEISSLRIELEQEKGKTGKKWTPATPYI